MDFQVKLNNEKLRQKQIKKKQNLRMIGSEKKKYLYYL